MLDVWALWCLQASHSGNLPYIFCIGTLHLHFVKKLFALKNPPSQLGEFIFFFGLDDRAGANKQFSSHFS